MKSGYIRLLGAILLGSAFLAQAIIFKVDVFKRTFAHGDNYVYCFSDVHLDYADKKITNQQRADLLDAAQKMNAYCILEDPLCYKHTEDEILYSPRDNFQRAPSEKTVCIDNQADQKAICECVPFGLSALCKERVIAHESIEFRHTFIEAAEKYKSIKKAFEEIIKPKITRLKKLEIVHDLKEFYRNKLNQMESDHYFKEVVSKADHSLDVAIAALKNKDQKIRHTDAEIKKIIANKLMDLVAPLFDCLMVQSFYENHMRPALFVVAGSCHIDCMSSMLLRLGYTKVGTQGNPITREDLQKKPVVINSIKIRDFFVHPIVRSVSQFSLKKLLLAGCLGIGSYLVYKFWGKFNFNQLLQYQLRRS